MRLFNQIKYYLVGIIFIFLFLIGCKPERIDSNDLQTELVSNSRSGNCMITIAGQIVDTKDLTPVINAAISSKLFTTKTNSKGEFSVDLKLSEEGQRDEVTIIKDGYLLKEFVVYYDDIVEEQDCSGLINIHWAISLSERKECNWISERDGAWYKIMDTVAYQGINANREAEIFKVANLYTVDVRRGTTEDWINLCVSPDHSTAVGPGIPPAHRMFSAAGFVVEDFRGGSVSRNNTDDLTNFNKPVEIYFEPPTYVDKNGELFVLDERDFSTNEIATASFDNFNQELALLINRTGTFFVNTDESIHEFCIRMLRAIAEGASFQELKKLFQEFLAANSSTLAFNTDQEIPGETVLDQIIGNCECKDGLRSFNYSASLDGTEQLSIRFPNGTTSDVMERAYRILRGTLADSGNQPLVANGSFILEECSSAQISSTETRHIANGRVLGFSFTYTATKNLDTSIAIKNSCAFDVDSSCHQGC